MAELNKELIVKLLETNDKAVCRAIVVLYNRQTATEQSLQTTSEANGRGFTGFDGKIGASMAQFYLRNGYLSPKQIAVWRKRDKRGNMKIARYWKQLLEEAQAKQSAKATPAPKDEYEDVEKEFPAPVVRKKAA
jgi:hypothetical protein